MKQIIRIAVLFLLLLGASRSVFAVAAPITRAEWTADFQSNGGIDTGRSTIYWQRGFVTLVKEENQYVNSGILWTGDINFNQDILSLTLDGVYDQPSGTSVIASVSFDQNNREYALNWSGAYYPETQTRKLRLKLFLATSDVSLSPKIYKIYLRADLQDRSKNGPVNRDNTRVSDLKKMVSLVEKYYQDFSQYPIVDANQMNKINQWKILKDILTSATEHSRKNYNSGFVSQPAGVDQEYQYGYLTNGSGFNYLFWVQLEESGSKHFQTSWQGTMLGIDCGAPIFCLVSKNMEQTIKPAPEKPTDNKPPSNNSPIVPLKNVSFLKEKNDPRVWLQLKDKVVWLRTPEIFQKLGGLWGSVGQIVDLSSKKLLKFAKNPAESTVYLIEPSGFKRSMINMENLSFYGRPNEITTVENQLIDALPENYLIRAKGDDKVYWLDQKIKRWITSPAAMKKMGFDFDDVAEVDPREMDYYPEGNPIF